MECRSGTKRRVSPESTATPTVQDENLRKKRPGATESPRGVGRLTKRAVDFTRPVRSQRTESRRRSAGRLAGHSASGIERALELPLATDVANLPAGPLPADGQGASV